MATRFVRDVKPQQNEPTLKCYVCKKDVRHPYGYILHGGACVCSRVCDEAYDNEVREMRTRHRNL